MKTRLNTPKSAGMTLIEMLAVIVIIAVLMGMLFPVVSAVRTSARLAQANTQVNQLAAAFKFFENEYGYWPTNTDDSFPVDANIIGVLSGTDETQNPRKIRFFDFPANQVTSEGFVDPFKGGKPYRVVLDQTYSGVITNIPTPYNIGIPLPPEGLTNSIAVYMQTNNAMTNLSRIARSWK
ncbi:type II secretion system protein [Kamptonema cortianum]|nr:type II secretion system protein [Kamptonema cortianum]MDL5044533.1 type II secretion system protein [Oscillatoria amoena NRMC-F 0135]